ncbi:hypothetical protein BC826DRAFT_1064132 [Russula brevipes]|nr:hypothetical protein BC826DRAFT_1082371 [Russula brevipes]KAI0282671.1 hypothetical protein BC826DRAFT_1064132 [Russula brevipes]
MTTGDRWSPRFERRYRRMNEAHTRRGWQQKNPQTAGEGAGLCGGENRQPGVERTGN